MFIPHLSNNHIIKGNIISQTPLLHLLFTLTRASGAIREQKICLRRHEAGADHAAKTLRDPSPPAPKHPLNGAPAHISCYRMAHIFWKASL